MHRIIFLVAFLACSGHEQHTSKSGSHLRVGHFFQSQDPLKAIDSALTESNKRDTVDEKLRGLATVLQAFKPAAFNAANPEAHIPLASSCSSPYFPTTVLVHGLDSSRETYTGTASRLLQEGYPCLTLDLRGHGESPLGDVDEFSASALAGDVLAAIRSHGVDRAILVGHSMGGRVAMRAAALDAASEHQLLASVIIEDMDITNRSSSRLISADEQKEIDHFVSPEGRRFVSWEAARLALLPWYEGNDKRVDSWRGTRVRERPDGTWWSDVNPAAQRLARDRVLNSSDGADAWDELGARGDGLPFTVHLWYADEGSSPRGTVVALSGEGSIEDMQRRLPGVRTRFFPGAGHSIHNTVWEAFDKALREVIHESRAT